MNLSGVDLPFQGVLEELAAGVEQEGAGGSDVHGTAHRGLVVVAGGGDAVTQDHADQQAWGKQIKGRGTQQVK